MMKSGNDLELGCVLSSFFKEKGKLKIKSEIKAEIEVLISKSIEKEKLKKLEEKPDIKKIGERVVQQVDEAIELEIDHAMKKGENATNEESSPFDNLFELSKEKLNKIKKFYDPYCWINDAAKRVSQLMVATHVSKFTHPAIKINGTQGQGIYQKADNQRKGELVVVDSNLLKNNIFDVVGNAAALDIVSFLILEYQGENLLSRILRHDSLLYNVLPGSDKEKKEWFKSFSAVVETQGRPASHTLAKQIYFPLLVSNVNENSDDAEYVILSPLFPTILSQAVFDRIQKRYDENTLQIKKARREKKGSLSGYEEFINLAIQNFGGSKPQNISSLNSKRGGRVYLLPSFPPTWQDQGLTAPYAQASIFYNVFSYRVRHITKKLTSLLTKVKSDYSVVEIREARKKMVQQIVEELHFYVEELFLLNSGWSKDEKCTLYEAEKFWLDPGRALEDEKWKIERENTNWQDEITHRFASWLNDVLGEKGGLYGDPERAEWEKCFLRELKTSMN